jgi:hypothetical protein
VTKRKWKTSKGETRTHDLAPRKPRNTSDDRYSKKFLDTVAGLVQKQGKRK